MEALSVEKIIGRGHELKEVFKRLAVETCAYLNSSGANVRPYKNEDLPFFEKLNTLDQEKIVHQLMFFHDLCADQVNENYEIKDNHSFVWRAMQALGLRPTSDLLDRIGSENIVEIHSKDNLQLFRNFKFFEYCSYSLEEVYCIEWWNLYHRDADSLGELVEIANKVYSGDSPNGFKPTIKAHKVSEIYSEEKLTLTVSYDWVAPVFQNRQVAGCVSVAKANIITV